LFKKKIVEVKGKTVSIHGFISLQYGDCFSRLGRGRKDNYLLRHCEESAGTTKQSPDLSEIASLRSQ